MSLTLAAIGYLGHLLIKRLARTSLLAHGRTVEVYRKEFAIQTGRIGLVLVSVNAGDILLGDILLTD